MKKGKDQVFTVNLHHDGIFNPSPLRYQDVHGIVYRLYYCPIRTPLNVGLKELKTYSDVQDFVRVGLYRDYLDDSVPEIEGEALDDPDAADIDPSHKVQKGVTYPKHDPTIPWNKMTPILGMRYEHPEQLKQALANYGVANRYQLWFVKNDWRSLLVYCGRSVEGGRCAGKYSNKKKKTKKTLFPDEDAESSKSTKSP
ncbi:splicing factor [Tanacetum coccineum]